MAAKSSICAPASLPSPEMAAGDTTVGNGPTRYEKTACSFLGVLCLAATIDWLKR